jgi:hypothetical protein
MARMGRGPGLLFLPLVAACGRFGFSGDDAAGIADGSPDAAPRRVSVQITNPADDAEQSLPGGSTRLNDGDLDLGAGTMGPQIVGLRFVGVDVAPGATILDARVQFQAQTPGSGPVSLVIHGQAADNAPAFTSTAGNLEARTTTAAEVGWVPPAWMFGEQNESTRTPDLSTVIGEIVGRPGWLRGNAIVLLVTGTGNRQAVAVEISPLGAATLEIELAPVDTQ